MQELEYYNESFPKILDTLFLAYQVVPSSTFVSFLDTLQCDHDQEHNELTPESLMYEVEYKYKTMKRENCWVSRQMIDSIKQVFVSQAGGGPQDRHSNWRWDKKKDDTKIDKDDKNNKGANLPWYCKPPAPGEPTTKQIVQDGKTKRGIGANTTRSGWHTW